MDYLARFKFVINTAQVNTRALWPFTTYTDQNSPAYQGVASPPPLELLP